MAPAAAAKLGDLAHLLPPSWRAIITSWLAEDTPSFDYGGFVVGESEEEAILYGKSEGMLAGRPFFDEVFAQLGCTVQWRLDEGTYFKPQGKVEVARVRGKARHILLGERVALNTLARCSGIATKSFRLADQAKRAGWKGIIAGTRKTTPGFRLVEKYGMIVGGIDAHRYDLSSMVMLKDNHIWSKGSIPDAIAAARSVCGFSLRIDVECTSEQEAIQAIEAGADVIMLDNFTPDQLKTSSHKLKEQYSARHADGPHTREFLIEMSGGITEDNLSSHLLPHVDIISTSSVHQSVSHVDFSLKIVPRHGRSGV
ncbi:uncharacterized protein L969DRAFT_97018 [Mixia osmundae IAM 14324]|uniref:Nicotinate-nucleotide pyrophosphorylase [carboxylating] n=1 Tax=Mixia osmundae (strain CBS 9802 / IAM 14324 / JCM 22182 / KY 12970) TaxID=764103 RepID=G7E1F2_MIXOS|nr:uncharacterized protein L969DRAFT_97018 [Mixia osmundae IAM 14324]KEI36616.1 hypothetical protein L969DRAFT_97018 [Mixia osmundae IAM 14324]GAA96662.1 hypothetical protein E5Q_03333 [Mixia osmundae IAM 14324]